MGKFPGTAAFHLALYIEERKKCLHFKWDEVVRDTDNRDVILNWSG